jgi:NDP-sugar pyrophosphorylase family protein
MIEDRINEAVLLAAGTGSRLRPYTNHTPKCLIGAGGRPLISYLFESLKYAGFEKLTIATGFEEEQIRSWIAGHPEETGDIDIRFVWNEAFATTNNIVSLWKLIPHLKNGFALIESDLIFDVDALVPFREPGKIALDVFNPEIHTGTTVTLKEDGVVGRMFVSTLPETSMPLYKTVNIASISKTDWKYLAAELMKHVQAGETHIYYEQTFATLIDAGKMKLQAVDFSGLWWEEVDRHEDWLRVEEHLSIKA